MVALSYSSFSRREGHRKGLTQERCNLGGTAMRWVLALCTDTDRLLGRQGGDRKASGVMEGGKSIPWIREVWADFVASQTLCESGS